MAEAILGVADDVVTTITEPPRSAPAAICSCGATARHSADADRCVRGHVLVGNSARRTHGVRAFETTGRLPDVLRQTVEEFREAVIWLDKALALSPNFGKGLLLKGAALLSRTYTKLTRFWTPIDLRFSDWDEAASLWAERHREGKAISDLDLLLAVLARREGAALVTANTRHFEGLGVVLQDWTK